MLHTAKRLQMFANRRQKRNCYGKMYSRSPRVFVLLAILTELAALNIQCATTPEPGDLRGVGKVTFPITCAPEVQSDFARGVALLHSFFYEEARRVFTSMAERDPKCPMAQWGIAMTTNRDGKPGLAPKDIRGCVTASLRSE